MGVRLDRQRRIMPFLFRQVRIHLAQGATPLRLAIRTISNLTGAALSIRQRDQHGCPRLFSGFLLRFPHRRKAEHV